MRRKIAFLTKKSKKTTVKVRVRQFRIQSKEAKKNGLKPGIRSKAKEEIPL